MEPLKTERIERHGGMQTMRISGLSDAELKALKGMHYGDAQDKLLEMLDSRAGGTGTCWKCGYGVYSMWFDNEYAYMNIGTSCD